MPDHYVYEYPRPALTVDLVLFAFDGQKVRVLLIRRRNEPFAGRWALPGGFVEMDEELRDAALRELTEETGLHRVAVLEEIGTFAAVGRDPRGRTISIAHAAVCRWPAPPRAGDDAALAAWLEIDQANDLAFDHGQILARALQWLRDAALAGPAGLALLPTVFDLVKVRRLFEAVGISSRRAAAWTDRLLAAGKLRRHPTQPGALRSAGQLTA
jgi:8-oxo-dGTP diphosphatase